MPTANSEFSFLNPSDQSLLIEGPAGQLELRPEAAEDLQAGSVVIICHPHPQHGGTLDNKVVTTVSRTCRALGWHSVRFNFRGVGLSEGEFGNLQGEIADLQAVLVYTRKQFPGMSICLAGFSFGSAVAAKVAETDDHIAQLLLVAPPVGKYDLDYPQYFACPTLVIQGAEDEIVDLAQTRAWAATAGGNFHYREMPDTGHFFHGKLTQLRDLIAAELGADQSRDETTPA